MPQEQQPLYIDRPPRIQPELPFDEIDIPGPPEKPRTGLERLLQIGLPVLMIMGYVGVSMFGGRGRSPAMMIPMALSVLGSVAFGIWSYLKEKREAKQRDKDYAARITEMSKEMTQHHDQQRRFYRYNYPETRSIFRIVQNARSEAERTQHMLAGQVDELARPVSLRGEARLWERRTSDDDFGVIRLGMGTLPSTVVYRYKEDDEDDSMLAREAMKLEADSLFVSDIPVILNLRQRGESDDVDGDKSAATEQDETPRTPTTHAVSIAGESESVYEYVRAMLAHFAVFHAPSDARLYLLAPSRQPWLWSDELPHCQDDDQNKLRCFVDEAASDERKQHFADDEGGAVEQFLEGIRKELSQRKIRLDDTEGGEVTGDPTLPLILTVVDLLDATFDPGSPMNDLQSDAAISILIEQGAALGAAVIFLVPERSKAPSSCKAVLEIEKTTPATNSNKELDLQQLHFRYAEVGVNSFRYIGKADGLTDAENMSWLAQTLAEMRMRQGFGANLTSAVMFLDLMGYGSLDAQLAATEINWPASVEPEHATFLRAKIGRMSGNKPRSLIFSAKKDGVHGMVAGSTGSGKSELLISLIVSMAVNYDPTMLNFVLVDYKGGGAFKEFEQLPHCVDIITNLEGDGVTRMFTAINSEMKRRQKLNADTGTKDIVDYHQQGYHLSREPYPFLFIIIDEFAEMIADRSEYKTELESITRVGRAQGVSLILAAQRPSGVTDQMRSNIKFRICLRVETSGESREMLRRGDAAFLPSGVPGRGYLQVGNDEIELIQVAYTGEKYMDPNRPNPPVIWPNRPSAPAELQDEPQELYKVLIERLETIARRSGVTEQRAPWPGFLPTEYTLNSPLTTVPDSQDPATKAITSVVYLQQVDLYLLGQEQDGPLTLNPSIDRWLNGNPGWIEALDWDRYALRPVVGLIDDPYDARQLPLTVDLRRGHVVIFGASGFGKTVFMRTLVTSLAATHSPNHVQIYILDLGGRNLDLMDDLPHVGAVILPDAEGYEERTEQLMRELESTIEERKRTLGDAGVADLYAYNAKHPDAPIPAIVLLIDNFLEFRETFENQDDSIEGAVDKFVSMARQSRTYGVHFVITATLINALPTQVFSLFTERMTLKMTDPTDYRTIIGGHVADISDIPGRGYIKIGKQPLGFQIALPLLLPDSANSLDGDVQELTQLIERMKAYAEDSGLTFAEPIRVDALPRGVLLKHMLATEYELEQDQTFLPNLKAVTMQNWRDSQQADLADWLNVTIGVISGNRPRPLELEAKKDGVHGLIAGGTGSGKSELLMTLIVGLALHYDPSILNFVLVDYKGGGAFKPFEKLPHCVDIITNLNKSAVKRMFTAINAEMQRRQALNAETNTKDIVEFRAKGLHKSVAPYPHLFIIIDEYAEMITDNPEFRDELDSITRVGRAQGVNLLLASQRPTGVSDQMRANIKFRICLRVEGIDTSREMLRRNDAAFLPNGMPGRGYLQVGNENIELMQVAYTGESVDYVEVADDQEPPKFYDVVVDLAQEILAENGGPVPRTPWPPFLETALEMDTPLIEAYLDDAYEVAMTLSRTNVLAVNPFVAGWLRPLPNPPLKREGTFTGSSGNLSEQVNSHEGSMSNEDADAGGPSYIENPPNRLPSPSGREVGGEVDQPLPNPPLKREGTFTGNSGNLSEQVNSHEGSMSNDDADADGPSYIENPPNRLPSPSRRGVGGEVDQPLPNPPQLGEGTVTGSSEAEDSAYPVTAPPLLGGGWEGVGWPTLNWTHRAMRAVVGLIDDPYNARQLPLVLDLTRGHGILFGASGWGKTTFLRSLVVSLAATHSPNIFHAHILDLGGRNLEVLRELPHVGTVIMPDERGYEERVQQLLREINEEVDRRKLLFAEAGVSTLVEYNANEDIPEAERHDRPIEPAILVCVDNFGEFIETFGDQGGMNSDDGLLVHFIALARQGKAYGLHFVITVPRPNVINSKLYSLFTERMTLRLSDAGEYSNVVGSGAGELEEIAGRGFIKFERRALNFQVALMPGVVDAQGQVRGEARQIRSLGQRMQAYIDAEEKAGNHRFSQPLSIDALPKSSSYRQVLSEILDIREANHGGSFLAGLKAGIQQQWLHNTEPAESDWLQVVLGITSGNKKRNLQLEAKKDGVHGMIAGGTGSGKSELLMTLIIGLAINYTPDLLNFVLVDYKGGGAFKPFENLPHCVDIVTNLNKAAVHRMFASINAEIRRRQALNVETGTKDIIDYRERGLHLTREPYPHLFVIIDEYSEMIDDNPDYRAELESITRVGRAQGVNLILASQRPKGVSDQMRANIKLRLCLRVEELDTSREMLRRPDAALLPNGMPGRGYLQIGNDSIELIQVSWTGEDQPDDRLAAVEWLHRPLNAAAQNDDDPKLFDAVVNLASELMGGEMARKPWPGFLPGSFSLQSELLDAKQNRPFTLTTAVTDWLNDDTEHLWQNLDWQRTAMRPIVGLVDDPAEASQDPLSFDLSRNHLVVMGDSGMGKTNFLRTLLVSLATTHTPNQLHAYVLDLGGRNFRSMEHFPHVGAVIYAGDETYEERLNRLLDKLNRIVNARQNTLSEADAENLYAYNQRNAERAIPAILVLIDNFAELQENYEMLVENNLLPLVRRSLSVGISFVVTCNVPNNMPSKLYNMFGERLTFKQTNADRYMDIVGRGAVPIDDIPGQGYIRAGKRPLLIQAAQPVGLFVGHEGVESVPEGDELRLMATHMHAKLNENSADEQTAPAHSLTHSHTHQIEWWAKPDSIAILPELVALNKVLDEATPPAVPRFDAVLGMGGDLQPAHFDLKRNGPHFAVVGPPLSGKTTAIYNWIFSLAQRYSPDQIGMVLIDLQGRLANYGGKQNLAELPHVLTSITEVEQMGRLSEQLQAEVKHLADPDVQKELFVFIDNFDDFVEEVERERELQRDLATMARRHGVDGLHFIIAGSTDSGANELRRRIMASAYGIGLRNAQSVEALRVMRTPAGLRNKELPVGRGYAVRSGQATMVQVATPFDNMGFSIDLENPDDVDQKMARILDKWVQNLCAHYPEQRAMWATPQQLPDTPNAMPEQSKLYSDMMSTIQNFMLYELTQVRSGKLSLSGNEHENGHETSDGENGANGQGGHNSSYELVTARFLQMTNGGYVHESELRTLLHEIYLTEHRKMGMNDEMVNSMLDVMEDADILLSVQGLLPSGDD